MAKCVNLISNCLFLYVELSGVLESLCGSLQRINCFDSFAQQIVIELFGVSFTNMCVLCQYYTLDSGQQMPNKVEIVLLLTN